MIPAEAVEQFTPPSLVGVRQQYPDLVKNDAFTAHIGRAYRQPWATAYFTALRDHRARPHEAAGIPPQAVLAEMRDNDAFVMHQEDLWRRRYRVTSTEGRDVMSPRPIWTPDQLRAFYRGVSEKGEHYRLRRGERPAFDRAVERGYLYEDRCSQALRNLWWLHCETYNLPYVFQTRNGRWYTQAEIDISLLYEADGRPRRFPDELIVALHELLASRYKLLASRYKRKSLDPFFSSNPSHQGESYFPYTTDDIAGPILALYRRYFPHDPAPNPETQPDWNPARVRAWLVPQTMTYINLHIRDKDRPLPQIDDDRDAEAIVAELEAPSDYAERIGEGFSWHLDPPAMAEADVARMDDAYVHAFRTLLRLPGESRIKRSGTSRFIAHLPPSFDPAEVSLDRLRGRWTLVKHRWLNEGWYELIVDWNVPHKLLEPLRTAAGINRAIAEGKGIAFTLERPDELIALDAAAWRVGRLVVRPRAALQWFSPRAIEPITALEKPMGLPDHLAEEWHPSNNDGLQPQYFDATSVRQVWWRCRQGHDWLASIASRASGEQCPYCEARDVTAENNLLARFPDVAAQWHPDRNGSLDPTGIAPASKRKVWWRCEQGHEWQEMAASRTQGKGCPICEEGQPRLARPGLAEAGLASGWHPLGYTALPEGAPLDQARPDIAAQWDAERNGTVAPADVRSDSRRKVWWRCKQGHEWQAMVATRVEGHGCPICDQTIPGEL